MSFKIEIDKQACIGCGVCAATCPDFFEMSSDGKSNLKDGKAEVEYLACSKEAAESCPANAIHITEDGKKIV